MTKPRVLILCTGNSARSQMAEGLFRHEAGDVYDVFSAGTRPSHVREEAVAVMREIGIDISGHRSKSLDEFAGQRFDLVITVCDNAARDCPMFSSPLASDEASSHKAERLHWPFNDPAEVDGTLAQRESAFRTVRDQIRRQILSYLENTGSRTRR